jgi:hypothetical protein
MKLYLTALLALPALAQTGNTGAFETTCSALWPTVIRVMVENDFRPTVLEKDGGVATFTHEVLTWVNSKGGSRKAGDALLSQYVNLPARGFFGMNVGHLRIDSASLLLTEQGGRCNVTAKLNYSVSMASPMSNQRTGHYQYSWYTAETNYAFETRLLRAFDAK